MVLLLKSTPLVGTTRPKGVNPFLCKLPCLKIVLFFRDASQYVFIFLEMKGHKKEDQNFLKRIFFLHLCHRIQYVKIDIQSHMLLSYKQVLRNF